MVYDLATAAAGDPARGKIFLVLLGVAWFLGYLAACAIWPFAKCFRCRGKTRFMSPSGKAWRTCRRCAGTGARLRIGRRIWNYVRRKQKEATK